MTEAFRQAQELLTHPLSHAFLALVLFVTALFALLRHYYKTQQFRRAAIPAVSLGVLFYAAAQLGILHATKPPYHWLFGRDLPVYLMFALASAFAVLGVIELVARRKWQGWTSLMQAAGSLALTAGVLKYAYAWPINLASVIVFLMLLLWFAALITAAATYNQHAWPEPSRQPHRA